MLTNAQYSQLKNIKVKIELLKIEVDSLNDLAWQILLFSNPEDIFNANQTLSALQTIYTTKYADLKTSIQGKLDALP